MIDHTIPYGRPNLNQGILIPGHRVGPRLRKSKVFGGAGARKKGGYADLMLTPMVDMFTLLVVYLIQSFSSTGEILHMSKDLVMPTATHGKEMELLPVVTIVGDSILMSGEAVADISDLVSGASRDPDWRIAGLEEKLREAREKYDAVRSSAGAGDAEKPAGSDPTTSVNIQADKALPFKVLKRVMYTCELAGYGNIHFAVVQGGGAAGTSAEDLNNLLHGGGENL